MNINDSLYKICSLIKIVKMLLTLVSVFLICWLPIQLFNLIVWSYEELRHPQNSTQYYLYFGLYFSFHLLSQFHTFLNPFIYCYMSNNFHVSQSTIIYLKNKIRINNKKKNSEQYLKYLKKTKSAIGSIFHLAGR